MSNLKECFFLVLLLIYADCFCKDMTSPKDTTRGLLVFPVNVKDCEYINTLIRDYENTKDVKPLIPIIDLLLNDIQKITPEKYSEGLFYKNTLFLDRQSPIRKEAIEPFWYNTEFFMEVLSSSKSHLESIKKKILSDKKLTKREFVSICTDYLYYKSSFFEDIWFIANNHNYIVFSELFIAKWPENIKIFKHWNYEEYCDEFKEADFLKYDEHEIFNVFPESDLLELKKMIFKEKADLKETFPFQLEILEKMIQTSEITKDYVFLWI